jgi:hypothetical protein
VPTITEAPLSEANIGLALGNRCISIGDETQVTNSTVLALSEAGVTYISTRSVGYNHIDVNRHGGRTPPTRPPHCHVRMRHRQRASHRAGPTRHRLRRYASSGNVRPHRGGVSASEMSVQRRQWPYDRLERTRRWVLVSRSVTNGEAHRRRKESPMSSLRVDLIIDHRRSLRPDGLKPC